MKRIKYFDYYGCNVPERKRDNSPAADTKVDYIISVLNQCGYAVDHISKSSSALPKYLPGFIEKQGDNTIRYFASFGKTNSVFRVFNRWFIDIQIFFWCLFNIKYGEQVIVYHSLGFDSLFIKLKYFKKIRIIGDIEEIYQDVCRQKPSKERNEYRFIEICDKFMFPNTVLNEKLNLNSRPHIVCHGIYKVNNKISDKFNDGKIHLLYSGTYDPIKGGAIASIQMAEYLPSNYHLHITGFGNDKAVKEELARIIPITKCTITYHGFLDDSDFIRLMQSCHIGLCTQVPSTKLNLTSFPSKILNYISNGLIVISGRNRAIEDSFVSKIIYFYDSQSPEIIANTVIQIHSFDETKGYELLTTLDKQFRDSLADFIEK